MPFHRFRLRGLMILVLLSALALAVVDRLVKMGPLDKDRLREGSIIFVPFLIMVALKFGLIIAARARRVGRGDSNSSGAHDDALP